MARCSMRGAIPASFIWFVIGADRIVRADIQVPERGIEYRGESGSHANQAAQRALRTRARGVNQYAAAIGRARRRSKRVDGWINISQAFNASQPRWTATFSNPNSRARKAATFALVHKPPSSGGSFNRRRSLSSNSGFNTVAAEPLRRRRSPKDSGPSAL